MTDTGKKNNLITGEMNKQNKKGKKAKDHANSSLGGLWKAYLDLLAQCSGVEWDLILHHQEDTEFKKHFLNSIVYLIESPLGKDEKEKKEIFEILFTLIQHDLIDADYLGFKFCILLNDSENFVSPIKNFLIQCGRNQERNLNALLFSV